MFGRRSLERQTRRRSEYKRAPVLTFPDLTHHRKRQYAKSRAAQKVKKKNEAKEETKEVSVENLSRCLVYLDGRMRPGIPDEIKTDVQTTIDILEREEKFQEKKFKVLEVEFVPTHLKQPKGEFIKDRNSHIQGVFPDLNGHQIITIHGTPFVNIEDIFRLGFTTHSVWSSQNGETAWYYARGRNFIDKNDIGSIISFIGCYTYYDECFGNGKVWPWLDRQYINTYQVLNGYCLPFCIIRCELLCM